MRTAVSPNVHPASQSRPFGPSTIREDRTVTLEDGRYKIDTNLVENAIRPTCIGKKNWLFIGHPDAGWRSAVIYSLLITARRYGLDPAAWLTDVPRRIPSCTPANLAELLPWNWKPQAG